MNYKAHFSFCYKKWSNKKTVASCILKSSHVGSRLTISPEFHDSCIEHGAFYTDPFNIESEHYYVTADSQRSDPDLASQPVNDNKLPVPVLKT